MNKHTLHTLILCTLIALPSVCVAQHTISKKLVAKGGKRPGLNLKALFVDNYQSFMPESKSGHDSFFFATAFPALDNNPVQLHKVQLQLSSYDTSIFDLLFLVLQTTAKDTFFYIQPVAIAQLKRHKLTLDLSEKHIVLKPGDFYMGYGFRMKQLTKPYSYRLRLLNSGGENTTLSIRSSSIRSMRSFNGDSYIFPFKVNYSQIDP